MTHKELFKKLDDFLFGKNEINHISSPVECCSNPKIRCCEIEDVCINCGSINSNIVEQPPDELTSVLNPKFMLTTFVPYSSKYRHIHRLHTWHPQNFCYKENMALQSYKFIKKICDQNKLNEKIYYNSCFHYKRIYIDDNISSRNKIKRCLLIYCIHRSCKDYNKKVNVITILKSNHLSITNYNKALSKIVDKDKLYLNNNMEKYYETLVEFYDTNITIYDIIKYYNEYCKYSREYSIKLNNNSILIGTLYKLLNKHDKEFYSIFHSTFITLQKFKHLLYLIETNKQEEIIL
jgi:hypothetical protein